MNWESLGYRMIYLCSNIFKLTLLKFIDVRARSPNRCRHKKSVFNPDILSSSLLELRTHGHKQLREVVIIKPRSRRLGGFLLCLRFIFFFNRAAVGWAVSCSAFGLFYFLNRAAVGWAVSCSAFGIFSFVGEQTQTPTRPLLSPDDVIIRQLQAISQLFSSFPPPPPPPQEHFVKFAN